MSTRFNVPGIWQPFGAFSMGVVAGAGRMVHLKGQVALDVSGVIVGAGDMRAQVRKVHENIEAALAHIGGRMCDIISLSQYTTSIEDFMTCGDIRMEFLSEPFPVTTTVEVVRLYDPALLIEITAVAEIPEERIRAAGF